MGDPYCSTTELQHGWGWLAPLEITQSCHWTSKVIYKRLLRTTPSWALNLAKDGDSTPSQAAYVSV